MANARSYTGGNFALDVGGYNVGYLKKVSGGGMKADVVENKLGVANIVKKHVAKIGWEEVKFEVGIGMGLGAYSWIKAAFDNAFITKQATLFAADFNHKAVQEMQFNDCLITEVGIPKWDGGSKDAAYFTIGFKPERVRHVPGDGSDIGTKIGPKQKAFLCSNFRLELGDLPCERVSTIDAMTLKCSVVADDVGIHRESTLHPAAVAVPDMKVTWSYADFDKLNKAAYAWFVEGQHLEGNEMTGRIVLLGPDMKKELGEIALQGVGWKSFKTDDMEGNSDKIKRCTGEFYIEKMEIKIAEYDA